ncbi:MAG: hypothetical protein M3Z04_23175 [Chloroflexota bacterium]|nr:hypothetical protein [Chloroflexota bacterium]
MSVTDGSRGGWPTPRWWIVLVPLLLLPGCIAGPATAPPIPPAAAVRPTVTAPATSDGAAQQRLATDIGQATAAAATYSAQTPPLTATAMAHIVGTMDAFNAANQATFAAGIPALVTRISATLTAEAAATLRVTRTAPVP